jgi:hypothetical protein
MKKVQIINSEKISQADQLKYEVKNIQKNNPYIDTNNIDRSQEIEDMFQPTLEDIKNDPEFYAELVNDLMFHIAHGTGTTQIMQMAINNFENNKKVICCDDRYNTYTHAQQSYADRSDYARELYESGRIDHIQMAEMRMGA